MWRVYGVSASRADQTSQAAAFSGIPHPARMEKGLINSCLTCADVLPRMAEESLVSSCVMFCNVEQTKGLGFRV